MGYDATYGKITAEHGDLPDDVPVFVLRGDDQHTPEVVRFYWMLCARPDETGSPASYFDGVWKALEDMISWQASHPDRVHVPGRRHG